MIRAWRVEGGYQGTIVSSGRKKSMSPLPSLQVYGNALESRKKVPFCFEKMGRACSKYMALVAKPSCCSSSTVQADEMLRIVMAMAAPSC